MLLDSLDEGTVQWGHKLQTITPSSSSQQHKLTFENGREETADLVVGADGAWSIVRSLLSPAKPVYSGISFMDLTISHIDTRYPSVSTFVGQGIAFANADSKAIIAQRNAGGRVRVYVALRVAEDWLDTYQDGALSLPTGDAAAKQEIILGLVPDWSAESLDLIRYADPESIVPRKIYALPVPHTWATQCGGGVTLLGDAAHVMSPFAGEGVNLAMIDAMELGLALVNTGGPHERLEEAIRGYETKICERAAEAGKESAGNLDLIFSDEAPKPFLDKLAFYRSRGGH